MAVTAQADDTRKVIAAALDPTFYRAVYPDVAPTVSPLDHYVGEGWRAGRDPAPWFSTRDYLAANPDVRKAGVDPLFHFLTIGRHQGREVLPSRHADAFLYRVEAEPAPWSHEAYATAPPPVDRRTPPAGTHSSLPSPEAIRAAVAPAFDATFYLASHPDVAASGMDPLDHFLITGWREGRDPTPGFSVRDYLDTYPDVDAVGINPFAHYLLAGRAEGRLPKHLLGFRYDIIARLKPVERRIAEAVVRAQALTPQPAQALAHGVGSLVDLHVTFSHDDYVAHSGGLQLCLRRESARFAERGVDHLHLYPAAGWQMVRQAGEPGPLGVMLNGAGLGVYTAQTVREVLAGAGAGARRSFAIHSLLGHEPDETADILAALGLSSGHFWLHDFASLCPSFHLLRNDVADCAAPPPRSPACGVCAYGPFRARHLDGHRRLFERLALTVVAPSQTTLDFWRARGGSGDVDAVVVPHARLVDRGAAPRTPKARPFRVAFIGMPVALKGWPVFRDLVERLADDPRYECLHLGGRSDPAVPGAAFHPAVVTPARPLAMQQAVGDHQVDAALIWPLCRETFSFTAYEAAAGGAAVITGPDSGNVAAFVAETGLGRVLADEAALLAAFESGEILALGRNTRGARLSDLAYSGLTGELVGA
jgi:hypothetical protein